MTYAKTIADQLNVKPGQVQAVIDLLENENTIPFIARYRKEATGNLDEDQIRLVDSLLDRLRSLDKRRKTILDTIESQGNQNDALQKKIQAAASLTELEDLYRPYKPKRQTRASVARQKGLTRLAESIVRQGLTGLTPEKMAARYLNEQVTSVEDALAGARDIVAEAISDHTEIRRRVREKALLWGILHSKKIEEAKDERSVYEAYYDFSLRVEQVKPYQVLAINRGEKEKVLHVQVEIAERDWLDEIKTHFHPNVNSPMFDQLKQAIEDAAQRLLLPAIERDIRSHLTEKAEQQAISVFASNLRSLLNQPPMTGYTVMGIDPGFRTGCKVAVVDPTGKVLDTATIFPHPPQNMREEAFARLLELVDEHTATLISIGNGTASRETEQLVAELAAKRPGLHYIITNEAGASVYSASPLAGKELPSMNVSMRGAVSIARRILDPLAELVKIEPRSIGVGMYQHDVNVSAMENALNGVVESVVNRVGVELNSASPALLTYVAGVGPSLAEKIVAYRDENGAFRSRVMLRDVSGLGPKAYEQCAGFLRIREGEDPLDASAIHPESYPAALQVLEHAGISMQTPYQERCNALNKLRQSCQMEQLAAELQTGVPTLEDIFDQLARPGRDPREDLPAPILRSDVLKMEDLKTGMRLKGTIRNVVDFGSFIDIGVKNDGLLHRSQIPPGRHFNVGDIIEVEVIKVEPERGRVSLKYIE
ncbi:MAG: RNA-binding transcriptional accessory protein [Chloroflexi bacterium]|nr:RNA-binding transcriptional accessory protein [Chloroflexota bacterium]